MRMTLVSDATSIVGALRYEFLMQARRRALWVGMAFFCPFLFLGLFGLFSSRDLNTPRPLAMPTALAYWTFFATALLSIGAGLLLADRFPRDRGTRMDEILRGIPHTAGGRIVGKYLGSTLATALPVLAIYAVGVAIIAARWRDAGALPLAAATFATITVPALLFVGAVSIACTTVLRTPLYQFLFVGYWIWTNLNPAEAIPTLNGTLLSPNGLYALAGFFGFRTPNFATPRATPADAVANIAVVLAGAALALALAWRGLLWAERR